jgi:hypothetical protein
MLLFMTGSTEADHVLLSMDGILVRRIAKPTQSRLFPDVAPMRFRSDPAVLSVTNVQEFAFILCRIRLR